MRITNTSMHSGPMASGLRLAVLVGVLVSPLHQAHAQPGAASTAPVLQDLRELGELRSAFESDVDKTRIVLLLSPT